MSIDFDRLKGEHKLSEVASKSMALTKDGNEFRALCPFHNEKTPSFTINDAKGFYHCFGCGAHGDVVDLVGHLYRVSAADAVKVLGGKLAGTKVTKQAVATRAEAETSIYDALKPGMTHAEVPTAGRTFITYNPKRQRFGKYKPVLVHPYLIKGKLEGLVIRAEIEGKKLTPMLRWARVDSGDGVVDVWTHWPFDDPRPLYIRKPEKPASEQVLVVEGEKAADAAYRLLGDMIVATWPGGVNAVHKANWGLLKGRRLVLWPDNDAPGVKAMAEIAGLAKAAGAGPIKIIAPDEAKAAGWDAADAEAEGWDRTKVLTWASGRATAHEAPVRVAEPSSGAPVEPSGVQKGKADPGVSAKPSGGRAHQPPTDSAPAAAPSDKKRFHFDCLGVSEDLRHYFFRPRDLEAVVAKTEVQLGTIQGLQGIYPNEAWWSSEFPNEGKGKVNSIDVTKAAQALMNECRRKGFFGVDRIRGVGAWRDKGRTVVNLGDRLIVDGQPCAVSAINSRFAYARRQAIEIGSAPPAPLEEARKFLRICSALNWEDKLSGPLLAGWAVSASVCGALDWRSHIWITGGPGSGKTTLVNLIVKPMLGELAVVCDGPTTEAAIRQTLRTDAKALFLDEFESRPNEVGDRVQNVLDLLRGASSGAKVRKGSATGEAIEYELRTAACFSSINPGVREKADEDRISRLTLLRDEAADAQDKWAKLEAEIITTITPQYTSAMLARTIKHLPTLLENIRVFASVGGRVLGGKRYGDQIAPMCAGAWLCYSDEPVTPERAEAWIREKSWTEHTSVSSEEDWSSLLNHLANCQIAIAFKTGGVRRVPLDELVRWADKGQAINEKNDVETADMNDVRRQLRAHGIAVQGRAMFIANNNSNLQRLFANTQWFKGWQPALKRVPGAELTDPRAFREDGSNTRGVKIPLSTFIYRTAPPSERAGYDGSSDIDAQFGE